MPKPTPTVPVFGRYSHMYMCAHNYTQLYYLIQHWTILIILTHILQTIITAQMLFTGADSQLWATVSTYLFYNVHNVPTFASWNPEEERGKTSCMVNSLSKRSKLRKISTNILTSDITNTFQSYRYPIKILKSAMQDIISSKLTTK